jgi:hypothetical protein
MPWNDADITELLTFRWQSILAGDINGKHPVWNSAVSNPSGEKPMAFFSFSEFKTSAPQCPTHYSPAGNGDVLDILVNQNIRVSDIIVSNILDSRSPTSNIPHTGCQNWEFLWNQ